ncbi:unnamed protein product [Cochlearia groenlandica]
MEMASSSLLNPNRSYAPISTHDIGNSIQVNEVRLLPPAWVYVSKEITVNIQRARTKMAELGKAHAKALMPTFGDGKEDQHNIESFEDSNVRKNVQVL